MHWAPSSNLQVSIANQINLLLGPFQILEVVMKMNFFEMALVAGSCHENELL